MSDITDNAEVRVVAERLKGHEDLCNERYRGIERRFEQVDRRFDKIDNALAEHSRALAKHDRFFYIGFGIVVVMIFFGIDSEAVAELFRLIR
ncbi:MAG: hypothetical protein MPJ53_00010 [Alphaproteobacteria bacterium]|nr:hypothetical protein [Alphaproteobacteria bacterium]